VLCLTEREREREREREEVRNDHCPYRVLHGPLYHIICLSAL
jgi:hypothetical protein